jgi:DNA mismatch repair protein MutS2
MEQTIAKYELEIMRLKDEKKEIIKKAKEEALQLLSESNARIELTIKEIKEAEAEKLKTLNIRQNLNDFKQQIKNLDDELMEQKLQRQIDKIKARQKRKEEKKKKKAEQQSLPQATNVSTQLSASPVPSEDPLQNGDFVKLKGQTSIGKIVKISGKEALVAFDSIQTNVKLNRLEHSEAPKTERRAITFVSQETQNNIRQTMLDFISEIDVRGMRTSEAIDAVTEFIDNAVVASASRLRILHGTGNGILRTMIRQYLSSQPVVATFYDEDVRMGGAGITIVELI